MLGFIISKCISVQLAVLRMPLLRTMLLMDFQDKFQILKKIKVIRLHLSGVCTLGIRLLASSVSFIIGFKEKKVESQIGLDSQIQNNKSTNLFVIIIIRVFVSNTGTFENSHYQYKDCKIFDLYFLILILTVMDDKQHTGRLSLPSAPTRRAAVENKVYRKNRIFQTRPKFIPHTPSFNFENSPQNKLSQKKGSPQQKFQQATTDNSRYSFPTTESHNKKMSVRQKLDQQLSYINQNLCERRLSLQNNNSHIWKQKHLKGPEIQRDLVLNYLETMYCQLQVPRFQDRWVEEHGEYEQKLRFLKTQPLQQIQTQRNLNNKVPKNSAYFLKSKIVQQLTPRTTQSNLNKSSEIVERMQKKRQISQTFRYCFVCQQPILQANIQIHEQQKCPDFKNLYEFSSNQIKIRLNQKINRIRMQCQEAYNFIFEDSKNKEKQNLQQILMNKTFSYLKISKQNLNNRKMKQKLDLSFSQMTSIFEKSYVKVYDKLRKLQWFSCMLINLQSMQNGLDRNFTKIKNI